MRILVIGNYFYPEHTGGIETVSYNLVKFYREAGHKVYWMAADVPPRFRSVGTDDVAIRAWNIAEEKLGFPQPIPYPAVISKLYNSINGTDIIHLQDCLYLINILAFLIAKSLRKPVLITQYAQFIPYRQFYKRALQILAYRTVGWWMFTTADKVVCITANVRDNMQYIDPKTIREVVPLGVDTDFYAPLRVEDRIQLREKITGNSAKPIILFVGRMVERKGIHLIRPLIDKHQEWHWILVGRPDDFNPAEWKSGNLIYFPHATEHELREFYGAADLLVHPSIGEGLTLIVSESLSMGTPVMLSEESLYEVDHSDRSLFFTVRPDVESIEEKLISVLADFDKLAALRRFCREFALHRLSWRKMANRYLTILSELLRNSHQK
jgi:phosphatidyl-myo-inositol dimannoside synthase